MIRTRVGYAGGVTMNPTYHSIGDHTEMVQVDFDPSRVSYSELLQVFWEEHDPSGQSWSRQYRNVILYHTDEQKRMAEESRERLAGETGGPIVTDIQAYAGFTPAEDYHQKHALRRFPEIFADFQRIYPSADALTASTAVARVNGYLAGYGSCETVQGEIGRFGLSEEAQGILVTVVCGRRTAIRCGSGAKVRQ